MRLKKGLTQKNVADVLGVSFQQIQKYETGKNRLPIENLLCLKHHYGTSFETFFSGLNQHDEASIVTGEHHQKRIIKRLMALENEPMKKKIFKVLSVLLS